MATCRDTARNTQAARPVLYLRVAALGVALMIPSFAFRRSKPKPSHDDAFAELFDALASIYDAAAEMKPEWRADWEVRTEGALPIRYGFGNPVAADGGYDTRFAVRLLQRNRWKSLVEPLFGEEDVERLAGFSAVAGSASRRLAEIADDHASRLRDDEIDWINAAIEQLDEATRQRRKVVALGAVTPADVAAAVYQPVYIAVQLADRLAERLFRNWEAQQ